MESEGINRRARRALWAFRLAFYPAVVALGAFLLIGRGDAATGNLPLTGTTAHDASITIDVDEDGDVGRGHYRLDAWNEDDRIEGVLEVVEHVNAAEGDDYTCTSETVGFTAQR